MRDDVVAVLASDAPCSGKRSTNILRRSNASHCTIKMTDGAGLLRPQISNDGSTESPADNRRAGTGLANLTARVDAAGGCLTGGSDQVTTITITPTAS